MLLTADFSSGSGYPTGFANLQTMPGYVAVNAAAAHSWTPSRVGPLTARFSIVNVFDCV